MHAINSSLAVQCAPFNIALLLIEFTCSKDVDLTSLCVFYRLIQQALVKILLLALTGPHYNTYHYDDTSMK